MVSVTGMGMVGPLGLNCLETWPSIVQGKSGVVSLDWDENQFRSRVAGLIPNFEVPQSRANLLLRKFDRYISVSVKAAMEAVDQAQLKDIDPSRIAVVFGSAVGGMGFMEKSAYKAYENKAHRISPLFIPGSLSSMAAGVISIEHGFKGLSISMNSACATGGHCIAYGMQLLESGDADVVLVGGSESAMTPMVLGGFSAMRALSQRNDAPEKASRPWDKDRDGFVVGEGAGALILERDDHAKARGAPALARCLGYGFSCDATHITTPDHTGESQAYAISQALEKADVHKDQVGYINAHATSTSMGDIVEPRAIAQVFGNHREDLKISSTKSMTGHLLGGSGAYEAIISIMALKHQIAPPTINLDNADNEFGFNFVPHKAQKMSTQYAMSNSFGFGGTNVSLLFEGA